MNRKKLTTLEFIEKAKLVHGNKYDYSSVNYINYKIKITIICSKHGKFEQQPGNHLIGQNCPICANKLKNKNTKLTTEKFIIKAKLIHGEKYDYSKVIYGSSNIEKVKIICSEHGEFEQQPKLHLQGKSCIKCGRNRISNAAKKNSYGWSISNWKNKLLNNQKAKPKLYVLKCFNNKEEFIKIGITIHDIKIRYIGKREMPYNYDILFELKKDIESILRLELESKKIFKNIKYSPKINFNGISECYNINNKNEIINWLKSYLF